MKTIEIDKNSSDYLRRHARALKETQRLLAEYTETGLSQIRRSLRYYGLSNGHVDLVWSNFLDRLWQLRLKSRTGLGRDGEPAYVRAVARYVTMEYGRNIYENRLQGVESLDEIAYAPDACMAIIKIREEFTRRYEMVRDTQLTFPQRLVCRAYTWHAIHHFGERIKISCILPKVNAELRKRGYQELTKDQFKKAWERVRAIMQRELEDLAVQLKEALSYEKV